MSSVPKPSMFSVPSMLRPTKTKSSERLMPVTISGFTSGIFVSVMTARRIFPRRAWMPSVAIVPSSVAMSALLTARIREFASRRSESLSAKKSR